LVLNSTSAGVTRATPSQKQPTPYGIWQCWDDGSPDSCHEALFSVSMLSATDGWATGVQRLLHWNGDLWTAVPNPTPNPLLGVAMLSSNDAWAVGGPGTILEIGGQSATHSRRLNTRVAALRRPP
jgi:pyruvate/2-oxoacid:ferredoxin oxidoreductase beta subunit